MTDLYNVIRSITGIVLFIAFTIIFLLFYSNVIHGKIGVIVGLSLTFLSFIYFIIGIWQIRSAIKKRTNRVYIIVTWLIGSLPFLFMLTLRLLLVDAH